MSWQPYSTVVLYLSVIHIGTIELDYSLVPRPFRWGRVIHQTPSLPSLARPYRKGLGTKLARLLVGVCLFHFQSPTRATSDQCIVFGTVQMERCIALARRMEQCDCG